MKKKVLHLLFSNSYSGAENVACTIIENVSDKYDVYYCCPRGPIEEILKKRKIKYLPLNKFSLFEVKKIIKNNHFDIIHAHDYKASFMMGLVGFKGKIISHLHCNYDFCSKWNIYTISYYLVMRKFSKIVAVSKEIVDNAIFAKNNKDKFVVIDNVIDKNRVINKSHEFKTKKYDLIYVGRLTKIKRPEMVIEITRKLKEEIPNIKTCIIGKGELDEECIELIKKYNLEANVDMLGFCDNPFPYMANSKVGLLPSLHEGLPMTVIESLILRVPVLNGGVDGLGVLFKEHPDFICNSVDEYCDRIMKIFGGKLNLEKKCNLIIRDSVDIKKYIKNFRDIYEEK